MKIFLFCLLLQYKFDFYLLCLYVLFSTEWGRAFPQNHHLVNLLSLNKATEGCIFCEPCLKQRKRRLANSWCKPCCEGLCSTCANDHASRTEPVAMDHQVLTLSAALAQIPSGPSCPQHSSKEMELFCTKCEQMICCLCFFDMHRKCDRYVHSLLTVYPDKRDAAEASRVELSTKKEKAEEMVRNVLKQKENVTQAKEEVKGQIAGLRMRIEEILKTREKEICSDLIELHDEQQKYLDMLLGHAQSIVESLSRHLATLDCAMESSCSQFMNIYQNMIQDQMVQLPQPTRLCHTLKFSPNQDYFDLSRSFEVQKLGKVFLEAEKLSKGSFYDRSKHLIKGQNDFGTSLCVKDEYSRKSELLSDFLKPSFPVRVGEFSAKLSGETDYRSHSDVICLLNGRIIISDSINCSVKQFNRQGHLVGCLHTNTQPFGVCIWSEDEIAITFPYSWEIRLVKHVNMILPSSWRSLPTINQYRGIVSTRDNHLMCSSFDTLSVDVLSVQSSGVQVIQHIEMLSISPDIVSSVSQLTTTADGDIFLIDQNSNCLVCLDFKGRVNFIFRGSESHCSVCLCGVFGVVANNDYIYLADTWKSRVVRLFRDGRLDRIFLTREHSVLRPQAVDLSTDGKLIILERSPMFMVHIFDVA